MNCSSADYTITYSSFWVIRKPTKFRPKSKIKYWNRPLFFGGFLVFKNNFGYFHNNWNRLNNRKSTQCTGRLSLSLSLSLCVGGQREKCIGADWRHSCCSRAILNLSATSPKRRHRQELCTMKRTDSDSSPPGSPGLFSITSDLPLRFFFSLLL